MRRSSHGFTLIELLVVITIIGILTGLLLSGVQMAREAARRATCANNLKQLSVGVKQYEGKTGYYPPGGWGGAWVGFPDQGIGINQPGGWIYQILPECDNGALHDIGMANPANNPSNIQAGIQTRQANALQFLYCTTRRGAQAYNNGNTSLCGANPSSPTMGGNVPASVRTDYAINGGSVYVAHGKGPASVAAAKSNTWPNLVAQNFNGLSCVQSQVTGAMLVRGQSRTYMIGEKFMESDFYDGSDQGDQLSAFSGDDVSLVRWANTGGGSSSGAYLPAKDCSSLNFPPPNATKCFGSAHGAGWNMAFCGGEVMLLSFNIDPQTHQTLAARNDHTVIDPQNIR